MSGPTARTLRLLSLLQTHRFWPGPDLAGELGVSERTLRRDVDRLRELGYPVDAAPGVGGGYRLAAGARMPPLLLDDDEAVAIAVGLRVAAGTAVAGMEETSLRALAKLEQVLPDRLRRRVASVHSNTAVLRWEGDGRTVDAEALAVLAQGCRDGEEVQFDYESRDGDRSHRRVRPQHLVSAGRRWYLVAWDVRQDGWRTFRVDRMVRARLHGVRFEPRPLPGGADPAAFVATALRSAPAEHMATVLVRGPVGEVGPIARWLDAEVTAVDDESCRVGLRTDSAEWLTAMLVILAAGHEIELEPGGAGAGGHTELRTIAARIAARLSATSVPSTW